MPLSCTWDALRNNPLAASRLTWAVWSWVDGLLADAHLEQHERGIHVVRSGTGGAGVTEARSDTCAAVHATSKLTEMPDFAPPRRPAP
jgi:hypothetical protein